MIKVPCPQNELNGVKLNSGYGSEHHLPWRNIQEENAKEQLAWLEKGSTTQSIEAAIANLDAAQAQLMPAYERATTQTIEGAQAELDQSVAQLISGGPTI
jgi:hypothetical protein